MGILGKWSYPMDYLCQCLYGLFGQWSNLWIISLCLTTRIMGQCATTRASTPLSTRITDQCPTTRIRGQCVTASFLTNIHKNYRPMSYHKDHEPTCYYTISIQCPQLLKTNVLSQRTWAPWTNIFIMTATVNDPAMRIMSQNTHHKADGITALSWKLWANVPP